MTDEERESQQTCCKGDCLGAAGCWSFHAPKVGLGKLGRTAQAQNYRQLRKQLFGTRV